MNKPTEIILHCAATPEGKVFTAKDIDRMHKQRGFKKIGYHYVIDLDGTVEKGREESESGAHAVNHNSKSIGICYIGGVAKDGKTPKDTRTKEQKIAMYELVDKMMKKYNIPLDKVYGHYQFANKACPSFKIEQFRKEFNEWKNGKTENVLLTTTENKKDSLLTNIGKIIYKIIDYLLNK